MKYQLNIEINEISKNNSINFQKIPDIFISTMDKVLSLMKRYFNSSLVKNVFLCKER